MNKVKSFITIFPILFFSYILFCFSSCSMKAEQKSLTVQFEIIDSLIMQSQFSDAVKDLKKLEDEHFKITNITTSLKNDNGEEITMQENF